MIRQLMQFAVSVACVWLAVTGAQAATTTTTVTTQRKLLGSQGLFDGLNAAMKVGGALGSQVQNGIKAGQKMGKVVEHQMREVINADAKVGRAVSKAADKAMKEKEKAVVIGIGEKMNDLANRFNQVITEPLLGSDSKAGSREHHHHSSSPLTNSAAKQDQKVTKAVEVGREKVRDAIGRAADERQQAIRRATNQIAGTIDHTHLVNNNAKRGAARAINKVITGRP